MSPLIDIEKETLERWWNEAQDKLPPEERRYTPSWLQKKEEALELKAEKYGVITRPKPKSWWQQTLRGLEWFGKTLAGPLIPKEKAPEPIKLPELKIPTEWPLEPQAPKVMRGYEELKKVWKDIKARWPTGEAQRLREEMLYPGQRFEYLAGEIELGHPISEEDINYIDYYFRKGNLRPPGFTEEQWAKTPPAAHKAYNVACMVAVIAGVTSPIWAHPSFPGMTKAAALKLFRGKLPERVPVETVKSFVGKKGFVERVPRVTMRPPPKGISVPTKIVETAIKQLKQSIAQVKIVKTEPLRGRLESAIYKAIKQVEPSIKKARVQEGIRASIDRHLIGAPVEVSPRFAKATIDSVFNDFPRMLEQARAYGEISPALFRKEEITPEEEIVEREIVKPLEAMPEEIAKEIREVEMEELYAGMPLPKSTQIWLKSMIKPADEPTLNVEKAVGKWYAQTNEGTLYGDKMGKAILEDMKVRNVPRSQMRLIFKYRQMPDKYADQVSSEEKEIADKIGGTFDELHAIAKENDILDAYIENYITQLYKDKPEDVWKKLYPAGGMRLGAQFRFARQRKIPNTDEAEKLGLHPIYDLDTVMQIYTTSLYRTLANKQFVDFIKQMNNKDGLPLIMRTDKAPPNYVTIAEPAFNRYMWAGEREVREGKETYLVKIPCKADPEVAKIINDMVNPFVRYKSWASRYLTTAQGVVKRMIMYNPMIHGWNVFSDTLDEANFNFVTAFKATFRGKIPDKLMKKLDFKTLDELDLDAVKHGLASDVVWAARSELYEKMKALEGTEVSKILKPLIKLRDFNDKVLWGNIVLGSQRYVYLLNIAKLVEKNPDMDADQLKSMAAHYTNDLLGTLPSIIFTKNEANLLRLFLFARNWTVSNLRLLTGALGEKGTAKIVPGFLRHKGLSAKEANKLAPHYQKHLIKGILALVLLTTGVNSAIKSTQEGKPTLWLPWEAEKGHEFDIDTGTRDKRGRKIYIKPPFFRYIGDYIGYATDPMQTVKNKMEPLMKNALEQSINYSLFFKRPIAEREGIDAIKDRLEYFFRGTTPYGTAYGVTQPAAKGWEKIIPFTGTWARHGITPEIAIRYTSLSRDDRASFLKTLKREQKNEFIRLLAKQNMGAKLSEEELDKSSKYARKIIDFREEVRGKWRDIDKEIDKLILDGKTMQAIKLMYKSGRYKSAQGMKDRIRRVKGGI